MASPVERLARLLHWRGKRHEITEGLEVPALDRKAAEVLARFAHEMRQPLSAALAALHVIRSSPSEPLRQRATNVVNTQFTRMWRLVDDLTETTRLHVDRPSLRIEQLDLRLVVQEVADAVGPQVAEKQLLLNVEVPLAPVWVSGDRVRLQQVISNLVLNAVKNTAEGGALKLSLTSAAGQAVLTMSDTGCGIAPELLPWIFEPFTKGQADATGGVGIGLTIARQLVHLHHGTIQAESAGPGRGSRFMVRLPLIPVNRVRRPGHR